VRIWDGSNWTAASEVQPTTGKGQISFLTTVIGSGPYTLLSYYDPSKLGSKPPKTFFSPEASSTRDNGLATKVGVPVGITLAAVLLCGVVCMIIRRRRKQKLHDVGDPVFVFKVMEERKQVKAPDNV
jgi:hypothetical protein